MNKCRWTLLPAILAGCGNPATCDIADTNSCASASDPATVDLAGGSAVFTREGLSDQGMTRLSVNEVDAEGSAHLDGDACALDNRGWGGVETWNVTFTDIPTSITYGELPDGATEGAAATPLEDRKWYQAT